MLPVVSSCKQTNSSTFFFLAKRSCQSCFYHITPRVAVTLLLLLWLSDLVTLGNDTYNNVAYILYQKRDEGIYDAEEAREGQYGFT